MLIIYHTMPTGNIRCINVSDEDYIIYKQAIENFGLLINPDQLKAIKEMKALEQLKEGE